VVFSDDGLALVSSGESYVTVHAKPATYLAGFQHFLGSGGWAFKQHVVPCVTQSFRGVGGGPPQAPFGGKAYRLEKKEKKAPAYG